MTSGWLCSLSKDADFSLLQTATMAKTSDEREVNYLRAWREFRRMTQEQLGAALDPPTTGSVISLLEDGKRKLSPKWLRRLAPALGTQPGFLLDHDPNSIPTDFLDVIRRIPDDRKDQALSILETFAHTGTNG